MFIFGQSQPADPNEDGRPLAAAGAARCCPSVVSLTPEPPGSRRRRLWELEGHAHCPVIGTCLPVAALRRIAQKVVGGELAADDYTLHCGAVTDCKIRTRFAEAVHKALDERLAGALRGAAACKSTEALLAFWQQQGSGASLPGALWAVLTHPRCTSELEQHVLGVVHMLQHQVGHADRADHARLAALQAQQQADQAALAAARQRQQAQADAHATERERWQAEAMRLRGQLLQRDALLHQQAEQLGELRRAAPDLPSRIELERRLHEQSERAQALQRALNQADAARRVAQRDDAPAAIAGATPAVAANEAPSPIDLADKTVLCVGGRTAVVPVYRRLVEACGARFMHHDGGEQDSVQRLESTLGAAELVICQTGCISHDAYWRVKDHCKRHGKRCLFLDKPSAAGLRRALEQPTANHDDPI